MTDDKNQIEPSLKTIELKLLEFERARERSKDVDVKGMHHSKAFSNENHPQTTANEPNPITDSPLLLDTTAQVKNDSNVISNELEKKVEENSGKVLTEKALQRRRLKSQRKKKNARLRSQSQDILGEDEADDNDECVNISQDDNIVKTVNLTNDDKLEYLMPNEVTADGDGALQMECKNVDTSTKQEEDFGVWEDYSFLSEESHSFKKILTKREKKQLLVENQRKLKEDISVSDGCTDGENVSKGGFEQPQLGLIKGENRELNQLPKVAENLCGEQDLLQESREFLNEQKINVEVTVDRQRKDEDHTLLREVENPNDFRSRQKSKPNRKRMTHDKIPQKNSIENKMHRQTDVYVCDVHSQTHGKEKDVSDNVQTIGSGQQDSNKKLEKVTPSGENLAQSQNILNDVAPKTRKQLKKESQQLKREKAKKIKEAVNVEKNTATSVNKYGDGDEKDSEHSLLSTSPQEKLKLSDAPVLDSNASTLKGRAEKGLDITQICSCSEINCDLNVGTAIKIDGITANSTPSEVRKPMEKKSLSNNNRNGSSSGNRLMDLLQNAVASKNSTTANTNTEKIDVVRPPNGKEKSDRYDFYEFMPREKKIEKEMFMFYKNRKFLIMFCCVFVFYEYVVLKEWQSFLRV